MTKQEAAQLFRELVAKYGLRWTAKVPAEAYEQLAKVNAVLDADEKRDALKNR